MLRSLQRWLPVLLIVAGAWWLRTSDLARRPMHADEANQAVKLGELLDTGRYAYDPRDHHGPTLYYLAVPIAWIRGESSLAELTEVTVRLLPAVCGTLSVLLAALLASNVRTASGRPLRHLPALTALFLAVSPPSVYYSRYFIQETLLVTFTLGAVVCALQWWRGGRVAWAVGAGLCFGLMLATKVTALVLAAAALIALAISKPRRPASTTWRRDLAFAALAAIAIAIVFFSSFFTHFAGLRDAMSAFTFATDRATGSTGHEKPWWYYLRLFTWHREGGLVFHQLLLSALAVGGAFLALRRANAPRLLRWAVVYSAVLLVTFSLTPYKTPWHVIHLVPAFALLAASTLAAIPQAWLALALAAFVISIQFKQTQLVAFLRPADARNPYAYVHSSPDVLKVRPLVEAALASAPDAIVRVIGPEYWPLPWYLRGFDRVGYWPEPPTDCDATLLVVHQDVVETVRSRLTGSYRESILGLRPGVLCIVFTRTP